MWAILDRLKRSLVSAFKSNGLDEMSATAKRRTWVEKVTDDGNSWLAARRLEDEEMYDEAALYYVQDAKKWLAEKLESRVALSAQCAARCLDLAGNDGKATRMYVTAGNHYVRAAEASLLLSPREASWAFERAADCYKLGGDPVAALSASLRARQIDDVLTTSSMRVQEGRGKPPFPRKPSGSDHGRR